MSRLIFYLMKEFDKIEDIKLVELPETMFITGIGTDVGKSYATGWLARELRQLGMNCITQKFIQTGNHVFSEDINVHRKVMGIETQTVDKLHITAPLILSYPASPDLAAKIDNVSVDFNIATEATHTLLNEGFSPVLVEGAGGIMVPLRGDWLTIDYIAEQRLPVVIVTNGQLGSINHTLLTLEACRTKGIQVWAVIYNPFFDKDEVICTDTKQYIRRWLDEHLPGCKMFVMPEKF